MGLINSFDVSDLARAAAIEDAKNEKFVGAWDVDPRRAVRSKCMKL